MCDNDVASTPFFTLAVTAPSFTWLGVGPPVQVDDAIKTLRKAYQTVFGRNIPARDRDKHLLFWTQICSALGAHSGVVEKLRQILPSLPDLTWPNITRIVGLDPSLGSEQLSENPLQTLYLPDSVILKLLGRARRSATYRRDHEKYSHLGSLGVKYILIEFGGFAYDTENEGIDASEYELELRIVHNAALLVVESNRPATSKVHAQAIAEATCLAASNSRLGYSNPIHVIVLGREQTTFYTYDPSVKQFYKRQHLTLKGMQCETDVGKGPEVVRDFQLQRMTAVLARDLFSLIVEVYHDFIAAMMHRYRLPLALQPCSVATEKLSVYDEQSFMQDLCTTMQPTGTNCERELHVKVVCHTFMSFIGFQTESQPVDGSRSVYYHTPNSPDPEFELRVEAIPRTESDTRDVMVTLHWRRHNVDWQLAGSSSFVYNTFFPTDVALQSKFNKIQGTGFVSPTRYPEFRDSMQTDLLRPLWDSIRENIAGTDTEALERALDLIEQAKPLMSDPDGTQDDREAGMEKLKDSVRGLPWDSQSMTLRMERFEEELSRFQYPLQLFNRRL